LAKTVRQREPVRGGGWYADPFDLAAERWWDGVKWTEAVRGAVPADAAAATVEAASGQTAPAPGMSPGWYPWRGEVWRWWDGVRWGEARKPVAAPAQPARSRTARARPRRRVLYAIAGGVAVVVAVLLAVGLSAGTSAASYKTRVGTLCTEALATYTTQITHLRGGTGHTRGYSQRAFAGQLFGILLRESAAFDSRLEKLTPPASLASAQARYLRLDRQDDSLYAPLLRGLAHSRDVHKLASIQRLATRNELELERLLTRLGGTTCSTSAPGPG
jgi:hypothetical protein